MVLESYKKLEVIKKKLETYGNLELLSLLALNELLFSSYSFHDASNRLSENPYALFLLGLFLKHNNFNGPKPTPEIVNEIYTLVIDYFDKFHAELMFKNGQPRNKLEFISKNQKILVDNNPNIFQHQKENYVENVLYSLNDIFLTKYGFTVKEAYEYGQMLNAFLNVQLDNARQNLSKKYKESKKLSKNDPSFQNFLKENDLTDETFFSYYTSTYLNANAIYLLIIDKNNFCKIFNGIDPQHFQKYLDCFSCMFGDQFDEFINASSVNIIFYKPIIKIDENRYFITRPDVLIQRIDLLVEYLLNEDRNNQSSIWEEFTNIKSKFVEEQIYSYFCRIFPKKNVYQNLHYWNEDGEEGEIDVLIVCANKIILVEGKSGSFPPYSKLEKGRKLKDRLKNLIEKAYEQNTKAYDFITSGKKIIFWDNNKEKKLLTLEYDSFQNDILFIDVTLESLGYFSIDLKILDEMNIFDTNYPLPWIIYFHDLETVTDIFSSPIFFFHYLYQRLSINENNRTEAADELSLLGYYLINGTFLAKKFESTDEILVIMPKFMQSIEDHYTANEKKPKLQISNKLKKKIKKLTRENSMTFVDEGVELLGKYVEKRNSND